MALGYREVDENLSHLLCKNLLGLAQFAAKAVAWGYE